MKGMKWMIGAVVVALLGLWLVLPSSCGSRTTGATTPGPDGGGADVEESESATVVVPAAVELEVPDAAEGEEVEEVEEAVEVEEAAPLVPETVAQKFVAAGGQKLCLAMVYALNPDWRMDACKVAKDGQDGEDRQAACENQRRPLVTFAEDVCKTVIEESLRLDLDPGMVLAVIERESSFGRPQWDRQDRRYEIQTNICELTLPKSRIVDRRPGRREGTELITWTYSSQTAVEGQVARNRQPVRVVAETEDTITLNTCSAGEAGIMQTVPREWRAGTVVEATGEVLVGSTETRRSRVEQDPILQVRLGCQALAEHRELVPVDRRDRWYGYIAAYNSGSPDMTDHARAYTSKIARHYMDACRGWFLADESDIMSVRNVADVWEECGRLTDVLDRMEQDDD